MEGGHGCGLGAAFAALLASATAVLPAAAPGAGPAATAAAAVSPPAAASPALAPAPASNPEAAFDFFNQEAEVVTASRREQKKSDSPVAIDVITRADIEASGARDIWDLLRFRVGMDVAQASSVDGNAAEVNVRGLPAEFSQSLQVLIDGRSVVSAANSGVYWQDLPVGLDDIERIEIVRGPNSPLFGANAGQGVINIITRKPGDGDAGEVRVETGDYGWNLAELGLDAAVGDLRLRVSLTDRSMGSFPNAQGGSPSNLNGEPLDRRVNARGDWDAWDGGEVQLFAGGTNQSYAIPQGTGNALTFGQGQGSYSEQYFMAKLDQKLGDHTLDVSVDGRQSFNGYQFNSSQENDVNADALLCLNTLDGRSATNLGLNLRDAHVASNYYFSGLNYPQVTQEEDHLRRAYAQEALSPLDWLSLSLAASFEDSDLGGEWPAYQGAIILKPWAGNTLRLSAGKSPTMPSMQNTLMNVYIPAGQVPLPLGPGGTNVPVPFFIQAVGGPVEPTQVSDFEATWSSSWLDRRLDLEVTGYQMDVDGQIETEIPDSALPAPLPNGMGFYETATYLNFQSLVARGTETVVTFRPWTGTEVQLNHTYEDVRTGSPDLYSEYTTPWNKANLLARARLPLGFCVSAQVGWVGGHFNYLASRISEPLWIPDEAVVDLRLGYQPAKGLELYLAGSNLAQEYRVESEDGTSVPRMASCGLTLAFGD